MTPWEFYGALEGWVENLHDRRLERGLAVLGIQLAFSGGEGVTTDTIFHQVTGEHLPSQKIDPEREEQYEADLAESRERARLARERGEVDTDG
jgi:hypothetical protein